MLQKIGLFGGSFDPIHFGHLILAREALEVLGLDRVVFIPAGVSPHKLERPPASAEWRLEMARAAVKGEPGFEVDDCELRREGVSFTIDTVRLMEERFPGAELVYFVGDDNLAKLDTWKAIDELRERVQLVVLARHDDTDSGGLPVIRRRVDISSTEIRKRVAEGRSIRYLLPEEACAIILKQGLYSDD